MGFREGEGEDVRGKDRKTERKRGLKKKKDRYSWPWTGSLEQHNPGFLWPLFFLKRFGIMRGCCIITPVSHCAQDITNITPWPCCSDEWIWEVETRGGEIGRKNYRRGEFWIGNFSLSLTFSLILQLLFALFKQEVVNLHHHLHLYYHYTEKHSSWLVC